MLEELQLAMEEVDEHSEHKGYLYRLQDVLIVMVLGLLCRNETIHDVYEWSQSRPVKEFFKREFIAFFINIEFSSRGELAL